MKATDSEIQELKARYGEELLRRCRITLAEEVRSEENEVITPARHVEYILKVPGRAEIEAVGRHGKNADAEKANEVLIKNCVVFGDMELLNRDGTVFGSVLDKITSLIRKREAILEKL